MTESGNLFTIGNYLDCGYIVPIHILSMRPMLQVDCFACSDQYGRIGSERFSFILSILKTVSYYHCTQYKEVGPGMNFIALYVYISIIKSPRFLFIFVLIRNVCVHYMWIQEIIIS